MIVYRICEGFRLRNLRLIVKEWRQNATIVKFIDLKRKNMVEDVFEAWKQRVAFKGGLSLHNHALKGKVISALVKYRKAAKVKRFRFGLAITHYNKQSQKILLAGLKVACQIRHE